MESVRRFDTRAALERLVARHPSLAASAALSRLLNQGQAIDQGVLVVLLQELLINPTLTVAVVGCFRPLVPRIVDGLVQSLEHGRTGKTEALEASTSLWNVNWNLNLHEYAVMALSRTLELAPHVLSAVVNYFSRSPPPFERLLLGDAARSVSAGCRVKDAPSLLDVLRASYRLMLLQPSTFRDMWDWSPFLDLLQWDGGDAQQSADVRWCATQVLCIVLKTSDAAVRNLRVSISQIHEETALACLIRWDEYCQEIAVEKAGMYLSSGLLREDTDAAISAVEPITEKSLDAVHSRDWRYPCVEVCGVELPVRQSDRTRDAHDRSSFVLTSTARNSLEAVVLALSQKRPVLLEGPVGAGKTSLIKELAQLTGNSDILFIHLDDQMDSKTLLGTYVCREVPGEFQWQPGSLTQAVMKGLWVVFEDIDRAPSEIFSALTSLLEDGKLYIPGRGELIQAAENFRLFSTVTSFDSGLIQKVLSKGGQALNTLWRRVVLDYPTDDELALVVAGSFPKLTPLVFRLVGTFNMMKDMQSTSKSQDRFIHFGHQFSPRDLMKLSSRVNLLFSEAPTTSDLSVSMREWVYVEAVDCFVAALANASDREFLMHTLANHWGVPFDRVVYYSQLHKPKLQVLPLALQVGRVTMQSLHTQKKAVSNRVFASTGHAMRTLESIAACVQHQEPMLLVGETGTGKTTLVQHLARQISMPLVVLNMSQQSDSTDFLGGFKPVEAQGICVPLLETFKELFSQTFSSRDNAKFLERVHRQAERRKWEQLLEAFHATVSKIGKLVGPPGLIAGINSGVSSLQSNGAHDQSAKRKRGLNEKLQSKWCAFSARLAKADKQVQAAKTAFAFQFVEGALVKALREGHWLLLDEINLAPFETLERLSGVLERETGTLSLTERGDVEVIARHPNFRIFACMNPATDVGKRDLPLALKNRFTEFFVDEMTKEDDLQAFVFQYLEGSLPSPPVADIVAFYLKARAEADARLLDGAGQKPQYSLRSLSRSLEYTRAALPTYGFQRALYDGLCVSFLTLLDRPSTLVMSQLIAAAVFGSSKSSAKGLASFQKVPPQPTPRHVLFEQFWVETGNKLSEVLMDSQKRYVLTKTIRDHLKNLARAVSVRRYPVLLQGPTSSGKTSLVEYLASVTGHRFVRINNHEHTELQEYLGAYATDASGKLVFQEGILVEAVRHGYWVVLDELNLAPSDVLEALNRLLDDNRELFVPELQSAVRAHPHFMLFATQNPPGVYGGRKVLSRAFRNRFVELHVDDIPDDELQVILENRCAIPGSYASKMVDVMKDLQRHRQSSQVFAGKHGFITARDLFRWGERHANGYEELASDGYMLLAERLRDGNEKTVVHSTLERHMRVKIDIDHLHEVSASDALKQLDFDLRAPEVLATLGKIVWTKGMKRLFDLVERCIRHGEPILLVGETGCGKTTVCQLMALLCKQRLHILNCHQHTETSDFLGGFRPVRDRDAIASKFRTLVAKVCSLATFSKTCGVKVSVDIQESDRILEIMQSVLAELKAKPVSQVPPRFEDTVVAAEVAAIEAARKELLALQKEWQALFVWHDGPLLEAMKSGDLFLVDEISLAEDSVLERLNSVLEPKRLLVLAEKGGTSIEEIVAHPNFRIMATMNPGGDFGKKELSPALRNRFTEIWVPPIVDIDDLQSIVEDRFANTEFLYLVGPLLQFWQWFHDQHESGRLLSVRDLLAWTTYINAAAPKIGSTAAFVHGAFLVLLDGLGVGLGLSRSAAEQMRSRCLEHLLSLLPENKTDPLTPGQFSESPCPRDFRENVVVPSRNKMFGLTPFFIQTGDHIMEASRFELTAPTTSRNAFRILRAMQLPKPVLIEGSPGVGKTSLVAALAASSGHSLVRINLSEQTDMMDLLGSDLPVDGGGGGQFHWSDGVFLQALKAGDWILLDELNLASQSVLEGLNSCLDHRAEVFVPELGRSFKCPPTFRIFACQNPTQQGGGRKGLPRSFLNRFTKVYVDTLTEDDYHFIASALHPSLPQPLLLKMIRFNDQLHEATMVRRAYGQAGSPWEFNLRDILRWCELIEGGSSTLSTMEERAAYFLDVIYLQRMRTSRDRDHILKLFKEVFGTAASIDLHPRVGISPDHLQVGLAHVKRRHGPQVAMDSAKKFQLLRGLGNKLEALLHCVHNRWMNILVGPQASGKTSLVRCLAQLTGNTLHEYALSSATDTTELLGSFEQRDVFRHWQAIVSRARQSLEILSVVCLTAPGEVLAAARRPSLVKSLLGTWAAFQKSAPGAVPRSLNGPTTVDDILTSKSLPVTMLVQTVEQLVHIADTWQTVKLDSNVDPNQLMSDLKLFIASLGEPGNAGQFEWVDGGLLRALESGDWVVLDNANLCNPTVLDRLNPLLEPGGVIMVNERGLVRGEALVVRAHPNFRLFLTVDPRHGEVSRAMRNRGVEVFMLPTDHSATSEDSSSYDVSGDDRQLVVGASIPGCALVEGMVKAHSSFRSYLHASHETTDVSLRELSQWVSLFQELLQRGATLTKALSCSWEQNYARRLNSITGRSAAAQIYSTVLAGVTVVDASKWSRISLNLPGGWPCPLSMQGYLMHTKESVVRRDSMMVDNLGLQLTSYNLALQWNIARKSDASLSFAAWLMDKRHLMPYLPGHMLRCFLFPSRETVSQCAETLSCSVNSVELEQMLKYAALWMVQEGTFSDMNLRIQWLRKLSCALNGYSSQLKMIICSLEKEMQHPLYGQLYGAWIELSGGNSSDEQPFIFGRTDTGNGGSGLDLVLSFGSKLLALRRSLLQQQLEDEAYEKAEIHGPGRYPTVAVSSYWHWTHRTDQSRVQIQDQAMIWMYRLLTLLRRLEDNVLQCCALQTWNRGLAVEFASLQEWHEALWKVLQNPKLDYDNFYLCWSFFKSSLNQLLRAANVSTGLEESNEICNILEMVDEKLSLRKGWSSESLLWKHGGHPWVPISRELAELEFNIVNVWNAHCDVTHKEGVPKDYPLILGKTIRWLYVEGLSIVRWLHLENLSKKPLALITSDGLRKGNILLESKEIYEMLRDRVETEMLQIKGQESYHYIPFVSFSSQVNHACKCVPFHSSDIVELHQWPSSEQLWLAVVPLFNQLSFSLDAALLSDIFPLVESGQPIAVGNVFLQNISASSVRNSINIALSCSSRAPADFVPHQHLIWLIENIIPTNCDSYKVLRTVVHELMFNWHKSMWTRGRPHSAAGGALVSPLVAGPSEHFVASQTPIVGSLLLQAGSVRDYRGKIFQLRLAFNGLLNLAKQETSSVRKSSPLLARHTLQQIIVAHQKAFNQEDMEAISVLLVSIFDDIEDNRSQDHNSAMQKLGMLLRRSQHTMLASLVDRLLLPGLALSLHSISTKNTGTAGALFQLGKLWVIIGLLRLHLLLPADGCDPMAKYAYKHLHASDKHRDLEVQLKVKKESELLVRGGYRANEVEVLSTTLRVLGEERDALASKIVFRPNPPTFHRLYLEVQRFTEMWGKPERLESLLQSLQNGVEKSMENLTTLTEEVDSWQEIAGQFILRLQEDFPLYRDIVQPIQLAAYELKFGLSLAVLGSLQMAIFPEGRAEAAGELFTGLLVRLMRFPSSLDHNPKSSTSETNGGWHGFGSGSRDVHELVSADLQNIVHVNMGLPAHQKGLKEGNGVELQIRILRVALLRLGQEILASGLLTRSAFMLLVTILDSLTGLWRKNIKSKEDEVQSTEFLRFTKRSHIMETDHDLEEESFKGMFPQHSWDFGDLEDSGFVHADEDDKRAEATVDQTHDQELQGIELAWRSLEESLLDEVVAMHARIFGSPGRMHDSISSEDTTTTFCLAYDTGIRIMEGLPNVLPGTLDDHLVVSNLMRLGLEHQQLQKLVPEEAHHWNFYKDANKAEIALMLHPLAVLVDRLSLLLEDWPEHPILQQLLQLSRSLLSITLDSPVIKALTGLELLLSKAQQWEENAAKHVSISGELESLSRLVTRWRKLELQCWPKLLDSAKVEHEAKDNKFWFFLHDILNGNVVDDVDNFIRGATKSVEEFMQSASVGQFGKRLELVRAFYGQFCFKAGFNIAESAQSMNRIHRLTDMLYNIWKYYSQFRHIVARKLSEQKDVIEKELKDLVRLSKWDDRSHYRLAASAEKTHRKLHKLVKKYNDILKQPVVQLLTLEATNMGTHNLAVLSEAVDKQTSHLTKETPPSERIGSSPKSLGAPGSSLWNHFCDAHRNLMTLESGEISQDLTNDCLKRLSSVTSKTRDFLVSTVFSDRGQNCRREGAWALDHLGGTIISRSTELRTGGMRRPVKKKALVDLLKTLKQLGLSRHKSAVPKNERDAEKWFQQPASEAGDVLCSWRDSLPDIDHKQTVGLNQHLPESLSSMLGSMCIFWHRASEYFFKNMALIQQLHQNALVFNKDLSFQEVETSTRFVEHLLYLQRQQRHKIYSFSLQLSEFGCFTSLLDDICTSLIAKSSLPKQKATRRRMWLQKDMLDSLICSIVELHLFLETSESVQACPSDQARNGVLSGVVTDLRQPLSLLKSSKSQLDVFLIPGRKKMTEEMLQSSWPLIITPRMQDVLWANFKNIRDVAAFVNQVLEERVYPSFPRVTGLITLQELLHEGLRLSETFETTIGEEANTISSTSEQMSGAIKSCEEVIVEVKLSIQGIIQSTAATDSSERLSPERSFNALVEVDDGRPTGVTRSLHLYEAELVKQMSAFRLDRIRKALSNFLSAEVAGDNPELLPVIARLLGSISGPLGMLQLAGMQILDDYILLHKTVTKLGYILGNLFNSLYREGFCSPPDEEEGQEGATKFEDAAGTGMGEGQGKKDVSEQIEDEDQLLGTGVQNMEPTEKEKSGEKQEKGIEMGQDFQADIQNVSEDESEEDEENEEGDEEKLDSMMGQADGNEQVVDERLWNDEEDKDTQGQQEGKEKYEKDAPVSGGKDDLEMRAKEGGENDREGPEKNEDFEDELRSSKGADGGPQEHEETEGENSENIMDQTDAYEDPSGVKPSQEEEDFELPDNMELDEDGGDGQDDIDAGEDMGESNQALDGNISLPDTVKADEEPEEMDGEQPEQETTETEQADKEDPDTMEVEAAGPTISEKAEEDNDKEKATPSDLEADAAAHVQSTAEQYGAEPQTEPEIRDKDARTIGGQQAAGTYSGLAGNPMSAGQDETEGQPSGLEESVGERDNEQQLQQELALETAQGDRGTTSGKPSSSVDRQNAEKLDANPYRSLGDTLKQWKDKVRVRNEVSESGEVHTQEQKVEEPAMGDEYQYATEGEKAELQALGGATEEQLEQQRLEDAGQLNETSDDGLQPMIDYDEEDTEEKVQATDMTQTRQLQPNRKQKSDVGQATQHAGLAEDKQQWMDLEGLKLDEELLSGRKGDSILSVNPCTASDFQVKDQLPASDAFDSQMLSDRELSDVRREVEEKVKAAGENAQLLWRRYDQLTARLSQELAEQLRLILEPTLAAKLEGDYRTGKRINMKKIIPYVASQFKKDKIWLRRTKASKRQYQVVIAIDDSRSMSESHCGHMALEALITTCRAMSQLEIGQMAVASFGEKGNARLLHDFDQPFSSESGTNIISRFSFQQDNTIADEPMVDLLHFLTEMLRNAAMKAVLPSGRNVLQQLVLIIADGRFHEKENLKRCVREAMTRNQLLAFIVLDNPQESIFDMQTVSFSSGSPTFSRYMDSFPFPYYTLLRNIEDLPRTLGGLLRQWFELMQRTTSS